MTDQLDDFAREYAELRRWLIEMPTPYPGPLTDEQRMIALSDGIPAKPEPGMWGGHESAEKIAEYNRLIGYKLSPLGNYGAPWSRHGPLDDMAVQNDPDWAAYLEQRRAENELDPDYGILRRMVEAERAKALPEV